VHDGGNDVRRAIVADLHDELTQIGFDDIKAGGLKGIGEVDFLGDHRLALDDLFGVVVAGDVEDDLAGVGRGIGEVNVAAVLFNVFDKLLEVVIEIVERVLLNLPGQLAHLV